MKRLLIPVVIFFTCLSYGQENVIPLNIKSAFDKGTRSYDGKPGDNYWQNSSDYDIRVKFDPYKKYIEGRESIIYYNNSPDSLDRIVVRLYQNFYRNTGARNYPISSKSLTDGIELKRLMIGDQLLNLDDNSSLSFTSTNLIIKLSQNIGPNSSVEIKIDWNFTIPGGRPIRMGIYDSTTFFIAYWYPQVAVFDDIDGWDIIDYNGEQEMYNDFNNYDVEIEVPDKFLVWSTGVFQNAQDVLSDSTFRKFEAAHYSDNVVNIISNYDYQTSNNILSGRENNIWHFKADHVTDFAFSTSDHFLWDALSLIPNKKLDQRVFISTVYNPFFKDFYKVAEIAKNTLEYFSTDLPGVAYPYPSITVFNGGPGGMEFPMIINNQSYTTLSGTLGLTSHEAAHTYFPFYMGINEKKYAWMDEGMAVMLPIKFQSQIEGNDPLARNVRDYEEFAGKELEMPPMIPSILLRSPSYRPASYQRPAIAYQYLEELLGRDSFRKAMQEYIRRWNGKHPIPYDYFNTFNNYLGLDLSWYWKPWFFEFGYPDLAIKSYNKRDDIVEVEVERKGNIPIPVKISLINDGEVVKEIYQTAKIWKNENKLFNVRIENPPPFNKIILGDVQIPDVNKKDNEFEINR